MSSRPRWPPVRPVGALRARLRPESLRWWARRWLEALEALGPPARLARGRAYAKAGRVLSIRVATGAAFAEVQGTRPKPHEATIVVARISQEGWARIAAALSKRALFAAKLLAGELPRELEDAFGAAGLPLFPRVRADLSTGCTCPDTERPCKHAAAACYVLAEEIDRDPFLLFKLRGLPREELLARLRRRRGSAPMARRGTLAEAAPPPSGAPPDLERFYELRRPLPALGLSAEEGARRPSPGGRARELGSPAFWRGEADVEAALVSAYEAVRRRVKELESGT